ncbi:MAG: substrate-binding domain-containing protein [Chloroflexota bacterium]|nr:substrate-binding domain-containing protein [Chloroflexota bacterium]
MTKPLGKRLPAGTRFVYLQCSTPICGLIRQLNGPAVKTIGGTMTVVASGGTASSQQVAASSALGLKPGAVLLTAITPSEFGASLKRLEAAGIKVTSVGVMNPKPYGIAVSIGGLQTALLAGKLMADWVIVHKGPKANVVFYSTPELSFSSYMQQAFEQELAKNCPSCKARTVPVSVTTFGSTAPQTIANDVASHAGTNVAVFATMEAATGLPAALKTAGISVTTLGFAPSPGNLQDIKTGGLTEGLGLDLPVQQWTQVDATARLLLGEPLLPTEKTGEVPLQFLGQKDITFDPSKGWTGYPNFAQMFAKLWHAAP